MRSFKSNENIHKKEGGSYYVVSANKASTCFVNKIEIKAIFSFSIPTPGFPHFYYMLGVNLGLL